MIWSFYYYKVNNSKFYAASFCFVDEGLILDNLVIDRCVSVLFRDAIKYDYSSRILIGIN